MSEPKNPGKADDIEIERKFLVRRSPASLDHRSADSIRQGYIVAGAAREVRLRQKEARYFLTVKSGSGLSRGEVDIELTPGQFEKLWPLTQGMRLEKRRHLLSFKRWKLELDVFEGDLRGLTLVEVEFATKEAARAFQPPEWFGNEVTGDDRYLNKNLALFGRPADVS